MIAVKEECKNCKMCIRSKHRTEKETKDLINRLNVIEGQIKGIRQMLEADRNCDDVLIQVSAVSKSLQSFGNCLLKTHLSTCVVEKIKNDDEKVIDEVMALFKKLY